MRTFEQAQEEAMPTPKEPTDNAVEFPGGLKPGDIGIRDGSVMGQNIVEPERMGPSPLAVSELAKEFRRLAVEAREYADFVDAPDLQYKASAYMQYGLKLAYEQAAQMLEERLNG